MNTADALQVQAYHTHDVTEQVRITPGWQQHYRQMSPGHFSGELRCLGLDGLQVYEERLNTRVEQFFRPPQGSLTFCFDRSENNLYLLNEHTRNIWITPEHYQEVAVVFEQAFLLSHGLDLERLQGLFMVPLGSGQTALFGSWLSATLTHLGQSQGRVQGQALAEQLLHDCLFILDTACQRLQGVALWQQVEARAIMRRVSEWAADCPEQTLNLVELASVAGVSLRQLQQAFKAFTGMPPAQWLRLRRLNGARRDLLNGAGGTVAEVAMQWSFWHLGRFSNSYRHLFKELPSDTLRRAKG
ncbi:helix-turn-helix domain-containing protein [Pseudomonas fulva]|uniref:helix-turn-helix domain-containing protein n=1 Tax=Pseudomonas TaxID=286 RepID=UPI0019D0235D|nr:MULTISPECIES: helix-turn-helix domain-containing protein [Pseudomonas]MBN6792855.1 helix-turn-helix domain-containing protein [Pseudomonas fulva]MBN6797493.1 helix-turn-helix domain-containing protein [Pseudomonas fulva]MBN6858516.1 helix-turn-helix domain-containing protein [Pseudomonas fulva]MBN6875250.1 helix-turn-helix domain-containing protein [Pseudomonas fulva]MBN6879852.1 helix-turn-helix domain-containing protein [Pseudomonas fulva]